MNNFYHKVAVGSICTALGFTLAANKEAKAATFILTDPEIFFIEGYPRYWETSHLFDNMNDLRPGSSSVRQLYTDFQGRAFYEFDIGNLSFAPNTVIRRAILKTPIRNANHGNNGDLFLILSGYVGNGRADLSDFNAGVSISLDKVIDANSSPRIPRDNIDFDVTRFVNERVNSHDDFAGFGFHIAASDRILNSGATLRDNNNAPPSLIIETADATEPVPEPTTIFGSALALGVGGWLKRRKSSQQNKTTLQN